MDFESSALTAEHTRPPSMVMDMYDCCSTTEHSLPSLPVVAYTRQKQLALSSLLYNVHVCVYPLYYRLIIGIRKQIWPHRQKLIKDACICVRRLVSLTTWRIQTYDFDRFVILFFLFSSHLPTAKKSLSERILHSAAEEKEEKLDHIKKFLGFSHQKKKN